MFSVSTFAEHHGNRTEGNCQDDNDAANGRLPVNVDAAENEHVCHDRNDSGSNEGTQRRSNATKEGYATYYRCRDRIDCPRVTDGRLRSAEPRDIEHACKTRNGTHRDEKCDADTISLNSKQACSLDRVTYCVDVTPLLSEAQHDHRNN